MSKVKREKARHLRFCCHVSNRRYNRNSSSGSIGQTEDESAGKCPIEEPAVQTEA